MAASKYQPSSVGRPSATTVSRSFLAGQRTRSEQRSKAATHATTVFSAVPSRVGASLFTTSEYGGEGLAGDSRARAPRTLFLWRPSRAHGYNRLQTERDNTRW